MFPRQIFSQIASSFFRGKVIILIGPRQVGKTTLVELLLESYKKENTVLTLHGEYFEDRDLLASEHFERLSRAVGDKKIIFIDEGQKVSNIGNTLKILIDHYKDSKQIIVTGSSSFHLLDEVSESLAGRKRIFTLFPIAFGELTSSVGFSSADASLESLMLYGMYPGVLNVSTASEKIDELVDLTSSALYRDILEFQSLKNPSQLTKLLKILALQVGQEVSLHALGTDLGMDGRTVERYIDLLEKSFIIFRLPPYFSNKKKEIIKTHKIYFYDLGIRNAILGNFTPLSGRTDLGAIWENWCLIERMKYRSYMKMLASAHFWRGTNQQEIDLVEDISGSLSGYEIKWKKQGVKIPSLFATLYKDATFQEIHRENYFDWM